MSGIITVPAGSLFDISLPPKAIGVYNLLSQCIHSANETCHYQMKGGLCGGSSDTFFGGNYTNAVMFVSPGSCVYIYNPSGNSVSVQYSWDFGAGVNIFLLTTVILYALFLVLVLIVTICCGIYGTQIGKRVSEVMMKREARVAFGTESDTCHVELREKPAEMKEFHSENGFEIAPISKPGASELVMVCEGDDTTREISITDFYKGITEKIQGK